MTRRDFLTMASAAAIAPASSQAPLTVPLHVVIDGLAKLGPRRLQYFWWRIWPQALREFAACGIRLHATCATGGVERPESCEPIVSGLHPGALNLVITNTVPMEWDRGLALGGVTTRYRGYHLCMIALGHANANQIPLLSLNTCVHEILHALMLDIFENRPAGLSGPLREFRIDWYATRLWLFGDCPAVRRNAQVYVEKLSRTSAIYVGQDSILRPICNRPLDRRTPSPTLRPPDLGVLDPRTPPYFITSTSYTSSAFGDTTKRRLPGTSGG